MDDGADLECDHGLIIRHYFRGNFFFDFVSTIPFGAIVMGIGDESLSGLSAMRLIRSHGRCLSLPSFSCLEFHMYIYLKTVQMSRSSFF